MDGRAVKKSFLIGGYVIHIVTSARHAYTHACLAEERDTADFRMISYADLFASDPGPTGTYVLTDFDRLTAWDLQKAAEFYRSYRKKGGKVLNDPARVRSRQGFLRLLKRQGINMFDAYRVEECEFPKRWPVFLRREGNHGIPISGLLRDQAELTKAIRRAVNFGFPLTTLLIIEYAAEPVRRGLFRKLSVFRVGEQLLGYTCVHDDQWLVKQGKPAIAPLDLYDEEFAFVRDNSFAEAVWPAFRLSAVEYGRMDFGLVDGRPQIYEINTNPELTLVPPPSPVARRNESTELFRRNYLAAMKAIDTE
jgi:hypothetical protein